MSIKIGGMASGIDTEAIITTLVEAKSAPITTLQEKVTDTEDKYMVWEEIDLRLSDLRLASQQLNSYSVWNQKSATSADESIMTATASLSAQTGTYNVNVSQLAEAHRISSDEQTSSTEALSLAGDFTVGGETITVEADDSLQDIRDAINTAADNMADDEKVKSYIIGNTLVIERVNTGDTDISISDGTGNVLQSLGVVEADGTTPKNELQSSEDLTATINGVAYTSSTNTGITDAISGVTLNFTDETDADGVTLTVGNDTETIKSLISDFVEKYNDLMQYAESATKAQLSENSNGTEELSAYGYLQGDLLANKIQDKLRNIITSVETDPNVMNQSFNSFYTIGVWFDSQENQLSIDEDKLNDALENNFDDVEDLFRAYAQDNSKGGVMRQFDDYLYGTLLDPVDGLVTTRMDSLETRMQDMESEINGMYIDLEDYEDSLWEHFAAMEDAVSGINSSWQYVASSLGVS